MGDHWISWRVWILVPISKLDGVAPLIAYPPPANSSTMHIRVVFQYRNLCLANQYIWWSGKTAVTVEPMMQLQMQMQGWVVGRQTDAHTHTDITTFRLKRPSGQFSEKFDNSALLHLKTKSASIFLDDFHWIETYSVYKARCQWAVCCILLNPASRWNRNFWSKSVFMTGC